MHNKQAVVAVYDSHDAAEEAVKELQKAGFDMTKLSILGRDYHGEEHVVGYYNAGERMKNWGTAGSFWGSIWGLLFGSAFFSIPGLGAVFRAGPVVAAMVSALEGAVLVGGLSTIGAGLFSLGVPKDSIVQYETAIAAHKFLLVADVNAEDLGDARRLMKSGLAHEMQEMTAIGVL